MHTQQKTTENGFLSGTIKTFGNMLLLGYRIASGIFVVVGKVVKSMVRSCSLVQFRVVSWIVLFDDRAHDPRNHTKSHKKNTNDGIVLPSVYFEGFVQ